MRHKSTTALIGLFVTVATVLALWLVVQMGSRLFKKDYQVSAYFEDVGGLNTGVSVRMAGYRIGQVSDITLLTPAMSEHRDLKGVVVLVVLDINEEYPIPADAELRLNPQLVLGEVYLDVSLGTSSENMPTDGTAVFRPGSVIMGKTAVEAVVEDAMAKINKVEGRLTDFLDGMNDLLKFLAREDMREDMRKTIANVRGITDVASKSMGEFDAFLVDLRELVNTGRNTFAQVDELAYSARDSFSQFNGTATTVERKITEGVDIFQSATRDLSLAAAEFTALLNTLKETAAKKDGTLGLLLNSPELHNSMVDTMARLRVAAMSLQRAASRVESAATTVDQQPSAVIWGKSGKPGAVTAGGQTLIPGDLGID